MIGIRNFFRMTAAASVTSSVATVSLTELTIAVAAGQAVTGRIKLFFSVGAAGGCRFQITSPAGVASYRNGIMIANTVAPGVVLGFQAAAANFTNALANAGSHWVEFDFSILNGATAGNITLDYAQNTSDATPITIFIGSYADVVIV